MFIYNATETNERANITSCKGVWVSAAPRNDTFTALLSILLGSLSHGLESFVNLLKAAMAGLCA